MHLSKLDSVFEDVDHLRHNEVRGRSFIHPGTEPLLTFRAKVGGQKDKTKWLGVLVSYICRTGLNSLGMLCLNGKMEEKKHAGPDTFQALRWRSFLVAVARSLVRENVILSVNPVFSSRLTRTLREHSAVAAFFLCAFGSLGLLVSFTCRAHFVVCNAVHLVSVLPA